MTFPLSTTSSASTAVQWQPRSLSPAHRFALEQAAMGLPMRVIRNGLKRYGETLSARQIARVVKSPLGQEYMSMVSAQLGGGIVALVQHAARIVPEAMHTEMSVMRNPLTGERHRLNAAQDLMDRLGPPKVSREQSDNKVSQTIIVNLTPAQFKSFTEPLPIVEAELVQLPEVSSANDDQDQPPPS